MEVPPFHAYPVHVFGLSFPLGQQSRAPSLESVCLTPQTPRPPLRDDLGSQPFRPDRLFADDRSRADTPKQHLILSDRPVVVGAIVLLLLASPFWPLVLPEEDATAPPAPRSHTAPAPVTGSGWTPGSTTGPKLLNATTIEAPEASPPSMQEAFWTTFDGTPAHQDRHVPPRRRAAPAESSPYLMDLRFAPQWAEPEADARHLLHLLQHLPAQAPATGRITSRFGPRRAPYGAFAGRLQFHEGIDVAVPTGTPVAAPGPGIVVGVGFGHRFGRYVRIRHEAVGLETLLAHLSSVEPGIRYGARVQRGQVVARSGNSGRSTGPHLHFEFRTVHEQFPVDPSKVYALYFQALDRTTDFSIASAQARLVPYRIEKSLLHDGHDISGRIQDAY